MDARPKAAAGGSQGTSPSSGRPSGRPRLPRRRLQGGTDGGDCRGSGDHSRAGCRRTRSASSNTASTSSPRASAGPPRGTSSACGPGASVQVEYFIYGAILMTFGLTFAQVVVIIVLGNLSYLPARAVLAAGSEHRHGRLRHQPGAVRSQRLPADLVLQLGHPDRLRGGGPHPHCGSRPRPHDQGGLPPGQPGQGRPGHCRRAHSGDPPVLRPRRHRQDAALADRPLRDPLRHHAGVRHPARQPARRQDQRGLAGLHGGAGLHHRARAGWAGPSAATTTPATAPPTRRRRASSAGSSSARPCRRSSS